MASLLIPAGLAVIMIAVGLETRLADFRALVHAPAAVAQGLLVQVLGLPLLAAGLAHALALPPEHAIGLVLLAAAPSGVTSNFVTLMARGDVALSVTVTVATSAAAPLTVPLWVAAAFARFADETVRVALPYGPAVGAIFVTTVVPLALGCGLAERRPDLVARLRPMARRVSFLVFLAIVAAALAVQWSALAASWRSIGPAALAFDLAGLAAVAALAAAGGIGRARRTALVMTAGLRNVALALTVAITLLGRPEIAVAATVYVLVMNLVALVLVAIARRGPPLVVDQGVGAAGGVE